MADLLARQLESLALVEAKPLELSLIPIEQEAGRWRPNLFKRAYLHPSNMKLLGIVANDPIYVANLSSSKFIYKAWPRLSVNQKSVQAGKMNCAFDQTSKVYVSPVFSWDIPVATKVSIMLRNGGADKFQTSLLKSTLLKMEYLKQGDQLQLLYSPDSEPLLFEVISLSPTSQEGISKIASLAFDLDLCSQPVTIAARFSASAIAAKDDGLVGGLDRYIKVISKAILDSLVHKDLFALNNIRPPKGFLLYGPPGSGKTMLAQLVAQRLELKLFSIDPSAILCKFQGESEGKLRKIFETARFSRPALIFFDELDALCSKREQNRTGVENRLVATLLNLLDGLSEKDDHGIFVIAATNAPNSIDPALRRPGRFDMEFEIGVPSPQARFEILDRYLNKVKHSISPSVVKDLANRAHGYVGADLVLICKEAALLALARAETLLADDTTLSTDNDVVVDKLKITDMDMEEAFKRTKPSALRENVLEIPQITWSDVGGQAEVKAKLRESIELPIKHPELFTQMGIVPPKGILLYGPPGCSKTLIAKALANESKLNFLAVKGPELLEKWVGHSEKAIRDIFRKARAASPSIIFFDEFDSIGASREAESGDGSTVSDRILSQLLYEMDGIDPLHGVIIIAATNRPEILDPALLRPGRLDRHIYIGLPNLETRKDIFRIQSARMTFDPALSLDWLASNTEGLSGAEILALCQQAGLAALADSFDIPYIEQSHFTKAFELITPRTLQSSLQIYKAFSKRHAGLTSLG